MHAFYLVYSPDGPHSPRVRHDSKDEALKVCADMARIHSGQEFFVLHAIARAQVGPVHVEHLVRREPVPEVWSDS